MSENTATELDPLVDSTYVRKAVGNKHRETLSRWIGDGRFPKPDRVINGRNYWRRSTLETFMRNG